jgi:Pyridoxamine 5'-phosphate oxidase
MAEILSDQQRAFLEANHSAVMATVDDRGRPHAVPVLCALVDGQLWSSGTDLRVRTRRPGGVPGGHGRRAPPGLRAHPERVYPSPF